MSSTSDPGAGAHAMRRLFCKNGKNGAGRDRKGSQTEDEPFEPVFTFEAKPALEIGFGAADRNYKLTVFRGVPQNPTFKLDELEALVNTFETRPGDTFICTYPKCGTTWMQQICHLLTHGGEQGGSNMYATCPWLEAIVADPILHQREANSYTLESIGALASPRFFKSHANFKDLPRGKNKNHGLNVIYVARNPKDACVSLWHHAREKPEFNLRGGAPRPGFPEDLPAPEPVCPDLEDFVKLFLAGECECGSWFDHTLEWYAASLRDPSVLFLTYEDMVKSPKAAIAKVALHIGLTGDTSALVDLVAANSSMDAMKTKSGAYAGNVRKGGIGNWRKAIPENSPLSAMFDGEYHKQMRGSALRFDFGDGLEW
eukprot:CAMPEP_0172586394 /NCGR_PEP_ID=MMETSP1068-20121228/5764_1 /TAXON_ID=35684 /ORGANISM="Pseudopedinella elastica, Strain CCMP716" /LENGTH=370 /DNA_ID=CAMNT_0013381183 /DNA_START=360 /DNA_END=1472 /DNA_ORIENTATION=-